MPDKLDPGEITVVEIALRKFADGFTYMGVSVGAHITDAQVHEAAVEAVTAIESYRGGREI